MVGALAMSWTFLAQNRRLSRCAGGAKSHSAQKVDRQRLHSVRELEDNGSQQESGSSATRSRTDRRVDRAMNVNVSSLHPFATHDQTVSYFFSSAPEMFEAAEDHGEGLRVR